MKEKNLIPIKLGREIRDFLINMNHNRLHIKKQSGLVTTKKDELTYDKNLNQIVRYFKLNNDRYLDLVKMEIKND